MRYLLFIMLLFFPLRTFAQAEQVEYNSKFFCGSQDRFLADEDFIKLALEYELQKKREGYRYDHAIPLGYEIGAVDEFMQSNPECCTVERDPNFLRRKNQSWIAKLEDWLDGEQIFIALLIPFDTAGEPKLFISYFTDECGKINRDRSFSISHYLTE